MSKARPDYTMFMKKPAPLEARFSQVSEDESAGDHAEIPLAEIMADPPAHGASSIAAPPALPLIGDKTPPSTRNAPEHDPLIEDVSAYAFLQRDTNRGAFLHHWRSGFDPIPAPLLPLGFTVILLALLATSLV
jgi:hypothetical protein